MATRERPFGMARNENELWMRRGEPVAALVNEYGEVLEWIFDDQDKTVGVEP